MLKSLLIAMVVVSLGFASAGPLASAEPPRISKIVAGPGPSCALTTEGTLYCWETVYSDLHLDVQPVHILGLPRLKDFDSGARGLSCGIDAAGGPVCWQPLFESAAGGASPTHIFVPGIEPGHRLARVAVGFSHVCALDEEGGLWCVGGNAHGELGTGDTVDQSELHKVAGLPPVVSFDTGVNNTCAVTRQGDVWCWGTDSPVADHPMIVKSTAPERVEGPKAVLEVQNGRNSMCATSAEPAIYCWGDNIMAQLGVPASEMHGRLFAVVRQPLEQVAISISSGAFNTCIIQQGGAVRCWGAWSSAARTLRKVYVPETKALPQPAVSVSLSAGNEKACALLADNTIWCWGLRRQAGAKPGDSTPYIDEPWQVTIPKE